jgi:hypothetical protein
MRFFVAVVVFSSVIGITSTITPNIVSSWAQTAGQPAAPPSQTEVPLSFWNAVNAYPRPMIWGAVLAALIIVGGAILLYLTIRAGANPLILRLTPSFFFWLGMIYTALLLLMAAVYNLSLPDQAPAQPRLLGGILPIAVPWFGALGAVTISLEGVFLLNNVWDKKFNYWHIGRPLFGAVLGIVAYFIFVVIIAASGTPPAFLDNRAAPPKDFIVFYILAFLVGYREETFRELIKRASDLILKPGALPGEAPAVTFRVGGTTPPEIQCPEVAANASSRVTVEVLNTGSVPLVAPVVTVTPVAPTPADTFAIANDQVTGGGDLATGQARSVDVTFTPPADGTFAATLTLTANNLTNSKTIPVTGRTP